MQLDDRGRRLEVALPGFVQKQRANLVAVERHMPSVETLLAGRRTRVALLGNGLQSGLRHSLQVREARLGRLRISPAPLAALVRERRARLVGMAGQLEAVSPRAVLARGYALVTAQGQPVTSAKALKVGEAVQLTFGDGTQDAVIGTPGAPAQAQGLLDF